MWSARFAWWTWRSTSVARRRRESRSALARSAAIGACRSPTAIAVENSLSRRRASGTPRYPAGVRVTAPLLIALCALALGGCGDTLQDQPIPHNILESLIESPFPVYWLRGSFQGLSVTEAQHDPGDAFSVQYGDCLSGGEGECVPPLRVVSSPDNSFLPGGSTTTRTLAIRGVQ